nr:serpin B4-like [Vicugna pacos]
MLLKKLMVSLVKKPKVDLLEIAAALGSGRCKRELYIPISALTAQTLTGAPPTSASSRITDRTVQSPQRAGARFRVHTGLRCAENPENHQFQKLLTELNKPTDAYELSVANRFYGGKEFPFLQEYMDNVKKLYLASVESADFANAPEESRQMINSWVEKQTNEKIKDLFPKDSLDSSTALVLVNAIYFKGQWHQKFKEENTVEEKFWLNKDRSKSVQMMKERNTFNFTSLEDMQVKILEIPYKGTELSMMLLLPNAVDGLQKVKPCTSKSSYCCFHS